MRKTMFLSMAMVASLVCATAAGAQSFAVAHARVNLVAEDSTLAGGRTAWVGVLFDIEKGWHIYWVNPGDSGQPPRIRWTLPAGFRAGEIRWPAPSRMGHGTVADYGYEGRVALPVPVDVPADYKPGPSSSLIADVNYLICADVCIPAKAHLTLPLAPGVPSGSISLSEIAARRELLRQTREHLPKAMSANWKAQAVDDGGHFVLSLETGSPEGKAVFFPLDEDQVDNAAPQAAKVSARGVQLTVKKSDQLLKPIAGLRGVIVLAAGAFEIAVPVSGRH